MIELNKALKLVQRIIPKTFAIRYEDKELSLYAMHKKGDGIEYKRVKLLQQGSKKQVLTRLKGMLDIQDIWNFFDSTMNNETEH